MYARSRIVLLVLISLLPIGCMTPPTQPFEASNPETVFAGDSGIYTPFGPSWERSVLRPEILDGQAYPAAGPFPARLSDLPQATAVNDKLTLRKGPRSSSIPGPIPAEEIERLREYSRNLPPNPVLQAQLQQADRAAALAPATGTGFDALDANDCCGGNSLTVPPDPELAVGLHHIITVVNSAFAVYDKSGVLLYGPVTFENFFSGVPNCGGTFDPNAVYDEEFNRFFVGVVGNSYGADYCVAVSQGGDPTGAWNRYSLPVDVNGYFFDYPHAGVGLDAIYVGANMFAENIYGSLVYAESRVWALNKLDLYTGAALTPITRNIGGEFTPQPVNLHGAAQGSWPSGGPHYFITDGGYFDGNRFGVWSWSDPFGANTLLDKGIFNLQTATGVDAGMPLNQPQGGSTEPLAGNDWRPQDAEYRNGMLWMAHTLACNPGGGPVNCIRWAQIDPGVPSVVDAGVIANDGMYRSFGDVAANDCDDIGVGYTKTSSSMLPAVWASDGSVTSEAELKAGERYYDSFQTGVHRWGDYSAMTIDPDGETFWYLGEYSKDISNPGFSAGAQTHWGTWAGSFTVGSCDDPPTAAPGQASDPNPLEDATDVPINAFLHWAAGEQAESHEVFFGTVQGNPAAQGSQGGSSFSPGLLNPDTTYYWRIDEVNDLGSTPGPEWSFTTAAAPPTVHVEDMNGYAIDGSRNRWTAAVEITVYHSAGAAVSSVIVEGDWSNGASGTGSCLTNGSGKCTVQKGNLKANVSSVRFTISNLSAGNLEYKSVDNLLSSVTIGQNDTNFDLQPDAVNDSYDVVQGNEKSASVLANDEVGNTPSAVTWNTSGVVGSLTYLDADGNFTYQAPADFEGDDVFGYTITDDDNDTDSATVTIHVSAVSGGGDITVSVNTYKQKGDKYVDLTWSGAQGTTVDIFRNGGIVAGSTSNDGSHTDKIGKHGGNSYQYDVCEAGGGPCGSATANF